MLYIREHLCGRNQTKWIVVGACPHRAKNFVGFGRREDELHMLRRFFDQFQQCVKALRRDHVCFIKDKYLEPITCRGKNSPLSKITCVINPVVASSIDFNHIERTTSTARQLNTAGTGSARRVGWALRTVQAPS